MTATEATKLASHAHQPEIAPHCEHGHQKTKKRAASGKHYWACMVCLSDRSRDCEAKRRANRTIGHNEPDTEIERWCTRCSEPMTFILWTPAKAAYWRCTPCDVARNKAAAAKARAAGDAALTVTEQAKCDYRRAWRNIQRLPKVEVMA